MLFTPSIHLWLGLLWTPVVLWFLIGLSPGKQYRPPGDKPQPKHAAWTKVPISFPRRAVATLMMGLLTALNVAYGFHHDLFRSLSTLTGISVWVPFCFTFFFLPLLTFILAWTDQRRFRAQRQAAA